MKNAKTLAFEWAYATSSHAAKFGHARTGCWILVLVAANGFTLKAIDGSTEIGVLVRQAQIIGLPWSTVHGPAAKAALLEGYRQEAASLVGD